MVTVQITADMQEHQLSLPAGSTVLQAIQSAGIILGDLDEVQPALITELSDGLDILITRVKEEYRVEQAILPFEHQELRNEALPEGEIRLSQAGVNGLREITYRRVYKDGVEVSDTEIKSVVITKPLPEVVMVGSQSLFQAFPIPGKIAYLAAGNAWIIEYNTGNRKLAVSSGDLDGRVFSLSQDGSYLLFTRFSESEYTINTLWVALLNSNPIEVVDLEVANIVSFAAFNPASTIIAYSTADWREASPGWHANNDLFELDFSPSGVFSLPRRSLEPSSGGVYGWWGSEFSWSPDGSLFLISQPDRISLLEHQNKSQSDILDITAFQTGGNWAWVPCSAWSPDGKVIFTVDHVISETVDISAPQGFNLVAIPLYGGSPVNLVSDVGMFAYPAASPVTQISKVVNPLSGQESEASDYSVAYLQALDPALSDTSTYRLYTIDRDGSNPTALFPEEGREGLAPQRVVWSPSYLGSGTDFGIVLVYNGDIWIINTTSKTAQRVTGDGLTSRVDWR